MNNYIAEVTIMPLKNLLDPQGKAVTSGLKNLGLQNVVDVRVGKHIVISIQAETEEQAKSTAEEACKKLLANPIMESYHFEIKKV